MFGAKHLLENSDSPDLEELWHTLELELHCRRHHIQFDIMWSPHKLEFNGENMESTAAGSNNRSDVMLLARPRGAARATIIALVYHTTNVAENTASMRSGQAYPETRLLWRDRIDTGELPNLAMQRLAENVRIVAQDIIPSPGDLPDPSDDESSDNDHESEPTVIGDQDLDRSLW